MSIPVLGAPIFSEFPRLVFGFSTRKGGVSPPPFDCNMGHGVGDDGTNVEENQRRFLETLGIDRRHVAVPKQIHSDIVVRVTRPGVYEDSDALMTNEEGVFLRVTVADCLPVFLFDPDTRSVGVVHCGWRGCVKNIVARTIERMVKEFSAQPTTIRAYIGPAARSCCYEVGDDVALLFESQFLVKGDGRRARLDMSGHAAAQLRDLGLQASHIDTAPQCTICTPDLFHSYRRDGARSGRMMGVIGLRPY